MNTLIKILMLVISLAFLSGCNLLKPRVITKTTYIVPSIPGKLTEPCVPPEPPDQDTYVESNPQYREELLVDYSIELLGTLSNCNTKLKSVRKIIDKTNEAAKKANKSEDK